MQMPSAESAFHQTLNVSLALTKASTHQRAVPSPWHCHLAQLQRLKNPASKDVQCSPAGRKPVLTTWKVTFLCVQQPHLALQAGTRRYSEGLQVGLEQCKKGVEHSLPSHSPPHWRPPKINSAPFPRRGPGLLQHLRAINLKEKVQQVFQFPSPRVGMLAFINPKWLMWKLYTSAQGYHFRWLFPCSLRELSFYLCQEGSDCKREALAPTTEGSLPLSLS